MRYNKLGTTSLKVSKICLGSMTFGEQNSEKESFKIMDCALSNGINFFDTAEMYPTYPRKKTQGDSERIIGNWINEKKNRDKIIIASKISSCHPKGIGATGLKWIRKGGKNLKFDRKNINQAINDSLKRLNTDYIDIYQLHWPERNVPVFGQLDFKYDINDNNWTPIPEVLENLNNLVKEGKIRYIGLSNETAWGITKYLNCAKKKSLQTPISIQNGYNLINRTFDISNSEISLREKISLLAHSPLAGGLLSGKYLNGKKPRNSRFTNRTKSLMMHNTIRTQRALKKYLAVSKKYNISLSNLAYAFVINRPFVASCIIGATSISQLENNIKSIDIKISKEILSDIDKIHLSDPNPYIYI